MLMNVETSVLNFGALRLAADLMCVDASKKPENHEKRNYEHKIKHWQILFLSVCSDYMTA